MLHRPVASSPLADHAPFPTLLPAWRLFDHVDYFRVANHSATVTEAVLPNVGVVPLLSTSESNFVDGCRARLLEHL
jgi:hypothetical protein